MSRRNNRDKYNVRNQQNINTRKQKTSKKLKKIYMKKNGILNKKYCKNIILTIDSTKYTLLPNISHKGVLMFLMAQKRRSGIFRYIDDYILKKIMLYLVKKFSIYDFYHQPSGHINFGNIEQFANIGPMNQIGHNLINDVDINFAPYISNYTLYNINNGFWLN